MLPVKIEASPLIFKKLNTFILFSFIDKTPSISETTNPSFIETFFSE